jgi:hypothetical protein
LTEHTDNTEPEDEQMTRVIETDARDEEREERWIDDESGDGWDDDEPIAARPRGRLLRPVPLALIALTIAAAGFLGGVLAQKGSAASGAAGGPAGGFAALAAQREGSAPTTPGASGASAATTGTVTAVEGHTIYVKESDGTVVAVKAGDGSTVTRDSNVAAKKVHPGDTVVVEGSKHGSTVKASSIAATESGVESTTGFAGPGAAAGGEGSESGPSVESLFGE